MTRAKISFSLEGCKKVKRIGYTMLIISFIVFVFFSGSFIPAAIGFVAGLCGGSGAALIALTSILSKKSRKVKK